MEVIIVILRPIKNSIHYEWLLIYRNLAAICEKFNTRLDDVLALDWKQWNSY